MPGSRRQSLFYNNHMADNERWEEMCTYWWKKYAEQPNDGEKTREKNANACKIRAKKI